MILNGFNLLELSISNDFRIRELNDMFLTIEFVESIYNPFIFGEILILDTIGITENFPLIGNEKILLKYQIDNPDTITTLNFVIYKITNENEAENVEKRNRILKLHICSDLAIKNKITHISKAFEDTPSNIIESILESIGNTKLLNIDTISDNISFISNYWTPVRIFKYICDIYVNSDYSDYSFFETSKSFNFTSISKLLENTVADTLTFSENLKLLSSYSKIKYFNQKEFFNILSLANESFFGKTTQKISYTEYGHETTTIILKNAYNQINTNGNGNQFNSDINSTICGVEVSTTDDYLQSFARLMQKNYNFEIHLNGDINRQVGQLFNINFKTFDNESETNEFLNGKWLNHTMKHIIKNDGTFEQNIRITKNAFLNTDDKVDPITDKVFR